MQYEVVVEWLERDMVAIAGQLFSHDLTLLVYTLISSFVGLPCVANYYICLLLVK